MTWAQFLAAFEALNERKRWFPSSLTNRDRETWKQMRRDLENHLFRQAYRKRHDSREFLRVPVLMKGVLLAQARREECAITTLGEGGCFIPSDSPLPDRTQLFLTLYRADGASWVMEGEVCWSRRAGVEGAGGMGIRFINANAIQRQSIYAVVDKVLKTHLIERCPTTVPVTHCQATA